MARSEFIVGLVAAVVLAVSAGKSLAAEASSRRVPTDEPRRTVLCWGDSITEGMGMKSGEPYPSKLQALLGADYRVLNSGDGGENVVTIPARQGALALKTGRAFAFAAGEAKILLGTAEDNGILTADGRKIKLTAALGREIPVNPVRVGRTDYALSFTDFKWNSPGRPISYKLWMTRKDTSDAVVIPPGTSVAFASASAAAKAYCEIFLMGANGGWDNDVRKLIDGYRQMIARRGEDKPYLVILPYWDGFGRERAEAFRAAFGEHVVDFRGAAVDKGIDLVGLMYKNRPDCHLNAKGYDLLAQLVFARGKSLGYW